MHLAEGTRQGRKGLPLTPRLGLIAFGPQPLQQLCRVLDNCLHKAKEALQRRAEMQAEAVPNESPRGYWEESFYLKAGPACHQALSNLVTHFPQPANCCLSSLPNWAHLVASS